ncbi:hypothetical protein [Embleya hyalina]|uniref:Uncharacterized protein n=1 Tax=Embleya hyalina TaxID=516124 RepID=A0A401YQJ3_9ACTN|nr:hypothetical protein [Embleya hyalina]GCD96837.1 hypothetical protein EHYA_04524 [Embleya hyalina]
MSSNGDDIRQALETLSREASPLREMPGEALVKEAGRRRRRRRLRGAGMATAAAMTLTVCGVGVFAVAARKSTSPHPSAAVPVPGDTPSWGAQEPGLFTCGRPIGLPTTERFDGVGLSPLTVERPTEAPDGPPRVTAALSLPRPVGLDSTEVYPTVLVLWDEVVVGGPIQAGGTPAGRPLRSPDWPLGDRTIRQLAPDWLCGAATWQQVWADPGRYTLALVMTPPKAQGTRIGDRPLDASNPLLIAKLPLAIALDPPP